MVTVESGGDDHNIQTRQDFSARDLDLDFVVIAVGSAEGYERVLKRGVVKAVLDPFLSYNPKY